MFELYDRIVTRRETVSRDQREKFRQLAEKMARQELKMPEQEIFDIKDRHY
ncbi:MAG: hypothetical protein U5N58_13715 [Actinomycetota bacterium]|nr:hypothetical protein [Actinomycetota bacterium]